MKVPTVFMVLILFSILKGCKLRYNYVSSSFKPISPSVGSVYFIVENRNYKTGSVTDFNPVKYGTKIGYQYGSN